MATIRDRYQRSSKRDKGRILDEFTAVTGLHRKHSIRLLAQSNDQKEHQPSRAGRRIYDEAVREAVILVWEASDRICGKRLKAALPHMVESMESHGHLDLDPEIRERLLAASAATLDRLLKPVRVTVASRRKRRRNLSPGRNIPVRTFADWNRPPPGFLEIDLVAHCGDNMGGSFIYSLVATDICTGWTEAVPLLAREQSLVVTGLEAIAKQLPFTVLGIDSDNDSVFINDTLTQYCADRSIEFTRSRAYRKNDQAWVEQKNGAVIRRFLGHERGLLIILDTPKADPAGPIVQKGITSPPKPPLNPTPRSSRPLCPSLPFPSSSVYSPQEIINNFRRHLPSPPLFLLSPAP